jgi:endonuclease YncB( thermonuclease family)
MRRPAAVLLRFLACAVPAAGSGMGPAASQDPAASQEVAGQEADAPAERRVVVEALDPITLRLADGGVLRLAGLVAPEPPLGYRGVWRSHERARTGLAALTEGTTLAVRVAGADRWGRALGAATLPDGRDLAAVLLSAGWAMVAGHAPGPDRVGRLELEAEARAREHGLWADAYYRVRAAEDLPAELEADAVSSGRFLLVEGRVREVAVVRGRAYLNFGPDWRTDFTATLSPDARRRFRDAGLDPRDWQGRTLRLRGWLLSWNGPMLELADPGQVEVLTEDLREDP